MIRKLLLFSAFMFSIGALYAQGEMDAYKLSRNDLTGTARSVSMGGAFGALGGDISGIAINPAGIGVYRSSEIVTTLNFQNTGTQTELNAGKQDESKFNVNFDNLAFVTTFPVSSDVAPLINFGFSYNRLKNFNRKYSMDGRNQDGSIADYMARRSYGQNPDDLWIDGDASYEKFGDYGYDWMALFGFNGYLTAPSAGNEYGRTSFLEGRTADNNLFVEEKGSVSSYDFNVGTTFSDIVSVGLTLSVTDIDYRISSCYTEEFLADGIGGFDLMNNMKTEGSGWQVGVGVIVKPVNELRIGLAYHSPTWYNMTDHYNAELAYDMRGFLDLDNDPFPTNVDRDLYTGDYHYDYRLRTPDRWTFSLAGIIGQTAIISADYELTNYKSNMKFFEDNGREIVYGDDYNLNGIIEEDFRMASTLRLGAEVRFTPQFSGRVGYSWQQSPLVKEFKNNEREVLTVGSISHFTLDGDTHYITYGLGYRFSRSFYTDIAFVMRTQKSDLYAYDNSEKASWKDNTFQGLLTLGYKF